MNNENRNHETVFPNVKTNLKSSIFLQVGSGEVFSIDEPVTPGPAAEGEEDEWQDVEVSEEWGPQTPMTQTPMTPLNDDTDEMLPRGGNNRHADQHRFPVIIYVI